MKAWRMRELGDPWALLEIEDVEVPAPGAGEVLIDVVATDLNFADILQCQGSYQVRLEPPFTPGMGSGGVVRAVGEGVGGIDIGQTVIGPTVGVHGGYAEAATLLAAQATPIASDIDPVTAVGMHVTYGTAWFGLHLRGGLEPGETVLVLAAAGGVGSAAVDLARLHGCWVIAAAGGSDKTAACEALGADEVVDYEAEDLYARVMDLTEGRGVDVVYDPVGGGYFDVARRLVAWEGRYLVVGFASGDIPSAPLNHALVKNYSVVGVHMGGYRQKQPGPFERCYRELHGWLREEKIHPLVDEVIGFDALPMTLKRLSNRKTKGRVIFDPRR